ncbi:MAG: hypothetical protein ACXQTQ_03960 [Candidatus Hecatellaceae archaeon]
MKKAEKLEASGRQSEEKIDELMAWISILESEPEEKDAGRLKTPPVKAVVEEEG